MDAYRCGKHLTCGATSCVHRSTSTLPRAHALCSPPRPGHAAFPRLWLLRRLHARAHARRRVQQYALRRMKPAPSPCPRPLRARHMPSASLIAAVRAFATRPQSTGSAATLRSRTQGTWAPVAGCVFMPASAPVSDDINPSDFAAVFHPPQNRS